FQNVQIVLLVEVKHLRDDAHAHPVALTQSEIDFYLLHFSTLTGTFCQPTTFCIWTRRQLSKSTSYRGMKSSSLSSAMALSMRARAAPRQLWIPYPRPRFCASVRLRSMSNVSGSVHARSSRLAEPPIKNTGLPSGIVVPCRCTSVIARRTL